MNKTETKMRVIEFNEGAGAIMDLMVNVLNPATRDYVTLEKIAVLTGEAWTEATMYGSLEAVRINEPERPVGYFITCMKEKVPNLDETLAAIFVKPTV